MAFTHFQIGAASTHGPQLRSILSQLENGRSGLFQIIATMNTMIDGDGSLAAMFPEVTARFGFQSDAQSKAAWDELNSLQSKLNTDASVSSVAAAMVQAFNKFR